MKHSIGLHLDFTLYVDIDADSREQAEALAKIKLSGGKFKIFMEQEDYLEELKTLRLSYLKYDSNEEKESSDQPSVRTYYLTPPHGQKSFYGKAIVKVDANGNQTLYSYNTPVARKDISGQIHRLWGGWSNTTGRHIGAFCGLGKREFEALELEQQ